MNSRKQWLALRAPATPTISSARDQASIPNEHSLLIRRTLIFRQGRLDTNDSFLPQGFGPPVVPGFRVTEPRLNHWHFGPFALAWMPLDDARRTFFVPCRRPQDLVEAKCPESHMWRAGNSNTWRAVLFAWGLILTCASSAVMAAPLNSPGSVDRASRSAEPFGLSTMTVATGPVLEKWFGVEREVDGERRVLKICEQNRASCQSQTALQFLDIVE